VVDVPAVTIDNFTSPARPAPSAATYSRVVARVDGNPITAEALEVLAAPRLAVLPTDPPGGPATRAAQEAGVRQSILELLIDRELAAAEALRQGWRPEAGEIARRLREISPRLAGSRLDPAREAGLEAGLAEMRRRLAVAVETVGPEEVRQYYQSHQAEMLQPKRLAIATLTLFQSRRDKSDPRDYRSLAAAISQALEKGESFTTLQSQHDEFPAPDPDTPPPLQPAAAYAEEILAVAGELPAGAVFGPVFMPGLALFGKVRENRPPEPLPFATVEKSIRQRLAEQASEEKFAAWLKEARKRAVVEITP
jgi:hypothetical protein